MQSHTQQPVQQTDHRVVVMLLTAYGREWRRRTRKSVSRVDHVVIMVGVVETAATLATLLTAWNIGGARMQGGSDGGGRKGACTRARARGERAGTKA